jgi:hypothetical protein
LFPVDLVSARAFFLLLHARLRVHRASGIPCALPYRRRKKFQQNSGAGRREIAEVRPVVIARECGRPSIPEAAMIEPRSRGVLDRPIIPDQVGDRRRAMTGFYGHEHAGVAISPTRIRILSLRKACGRSYLSVRG